MISTTIALENHLNAITELNRNMPPFAAGYRQHREGKEALVEHRNAVASFVGATFLDGASFDDASIHHGESTLLDNPRVPDALHEAIVSVPGLVLDHVYLFRHSGEPVAVVTMPYFHRDDFTADGANDRAVWRSLDEFSWWMPRETKLTLITSPAFPVRVSYVHDWE